MAEWCPHCNRKIEPDGCWPTEEDQDCWELRHLGASPHLTAEVWVTKGTGLSDEAAAALAELHGIEIEDDAE